MATAPEEAENVEQMVGTVDVPIDENGELMLEEEDKGVECIEVKGGKLKYINNKYKKVDGKMYDYKCDVKLSVAGEKFKAHRDVLSEASDYFSAMFGINMKEKEQKEIELKDISPKGFGAMLEYFYHGHVTLEPDIIDDVLEAARFFHVDWILDIACDYLVRHLSLDNYPVVMHLSDKYSLGDLRWDIFRFLGQNLPTMIEQPDFLKKLSDDLLLQFLMEYLYVEMSEYQLLDVVLKWMRMDEENRKEHLLPMLRQIRFPVMELEELESLPAEVLQFPDIKEEVDNAKSYLLDVPSQCLKTDDKYLPRGARPSVVVMAFSEDTGNIVMYKDSEKANLLIEQLGASALEVDYSSASQTTLGNFVYAAGGYSEPGTSSGQVFRYDPKYRDWTEIATMKVPRVSFAICSSNTRMFAMGGVRHTTVDGLESEVILKSVEMYVPEENEWKTLPDLPFGSFDQAAAFCNSKVYVSGGISSDPSHSVPINFMNALTVDGDQWEKMPPMLSSRQGHSMSTLNNKLYVLGGYTATDFSTFRDCAENEVFDVETKQWTAIKSTPDSYGHLYRHVTVFRNKIFFLSGVFINAYLNYYDAETDSIEEVDALGTNVHKLACVKVAYPYT